MFPSVSSRDNNCEIKNFPVNSGRIFQLPNELVINILSFLGDKAIVNFGRSSKLYYNITSLIDLPCKKFFIKCNAKIKKLREAIFNYALSETECECLGIRVKDHSIAFFIQTKFFDTKAYCQALENLFYEFTVFSYYSINNKEKFHSYFEFVIKLISKPFKPDERGFLQCFIDFKLTEEALSQAVTDFKFKKCITAFSMEVVRYLIRSYVSQPLSAITKQSYEEKLDQTRLYCPDNPEFVKNLLEESLLKVHGQEGLRKTLE